MVHQAAGGPDRGMLSDVELAEAIFEPTGPQLAANEMHQWVWAAAERLWATGHYREALQAAATAVESQVQGKTGVHKLAGADLLRKVFNVDDPKPGEPRLRLDYPTSGLSWRSAHEGAANFGAGCMMAIRNIVSHNLAVPDEADALEQLAALSVLAKWVDRARVEESPPSAEDGAGGDTVTASRANVSHVGRLRCPPWPFGMAELSTGGHRAPLVPFYPSPPLTRLLAGRQHPPGDSRRPHKD